MKQYSKTGKGIRGRAGFSLAGTLVAAAIMGLLAMVFSQLITNSQKGQKGVQNSLDFDILRSSVKLVLDKSDLCKDALFNKNGNNRAKFKPGTTFSAAHALGSIRVGNTLIVKNGENLGAGLKVSKLELVDSGLAPVASGFFKTYTVKLIIEAAKTQINFGGQRFSNAANPFVISVTTRPDNTIVSCAAPALACQVVTRLSTSDSWNQVCCDGNDVAVAGTTPEDPNDSSMRWDANPSCMSVKDVGAGNDVQLRCCK